MSSIEEHERLLNRMEAQMAGESSESDTIRNWLTTQEGRLRASLRRMEADERLDSHYRELVRLREVRYDLDALQRVLGMLDT